MREAASTMDGTSASRAGPRHGRYLAVGLLVMASRVGGIPALVDHDLDGPLVPPRNAAALAAPSPAFSPSRAPPPGWPLPPGRLPSGTPGPCWPARSPRPIWR